MGMWRPVQKLPAAELHDLNNIVLQDNVISEDSDSFDIMDISENSEWNFKSITSNSTVSSDGSDISQNSDISDNSNYWDSSESSYSSACSDISGNNDSSKRSDTISDRKKGQYEFSVVT